MDKSQGLSEIELMWLIAWNLAAGYWDKVALAPDQAKTLMFDFARQLQGNPLEAARNSWIHMRQALMTLRKDSFEDIQAEAPFRPHAYRNLQRLLTAHIESGDLGMEKAWQEIFPEGREVEPEKYQPIRVIGGNGESEETALEVIGAPDRETRVAAEWWYLRYQFGWEWEPGIHMTTTKNASGERFSVHDGQLSSGVGKQLFFRLPW